ncbi:uncharacterized protein N7515_007126 [Penicillium bovifimosum]|uniref:Uncharacterized protein n=1 Tax=Penicillium bovifimosum TaxID=126998 RepID=A0A9W9L1X6_9EURO|nr:uncharacterized protein N7515_007126 [Penicillium bovifimosum]KAJ5131087.1 hypothetical protein N7515_007126 [Penicillium bovifimosum]
MNYATCNELASIADMNRIWTLQLTIMEAGLKSIIRLEWNFDLGTRHHRGHAHDAMFDTTQRMVPIGTWKSEPCDVGIEYSDLRRWIARFDELEG